MLDDKVCVVTGSGGGIGRATAIEMARQGARVVVSDIQDDTGRETGGLVEEAGGAAHWKSCSVRVPRPVEELVEGTLEPFGGAGGPPTNAGVPETEFTSA